MEVVYIDSVWALNTLMDYLLLLATAHLAGIPVRRLRILCAAVLGGCYAAAVFLPGCGFLASSPLKGLFGVLLSGVAFGGQRRFLRLTILFFAVSCGFAGCVLALGLIGGGSVPSAQGIFYTDISGRVLLISATAAYGVFSVVFRAGAKHGGAGGELVKIRIGLADRSVELTALLDTGCSLLDPISGQPVLVAEAEALHGLWPGRLAPLLSARTLQDPACALERLQVAGAAGKFRLMTYRTVGQRESLLLAFRSTCTWIAGQPHPGLLVALSPNGLGDGFAALWGGGSGRGGERNADRVPGSDAPAADPAGAFDRSTHSLHRRQ